MSDHTDDVMTKLFPQIRKAAEKGLADTSLRTLFDVETTADSLPYRLKTFTWTHDDQRNLEHFSGASERAWRIVHEAELELDGLDVLENARLDQVTVMARDARAKEQAGVFAAAALEGPHGYYHAQGLKAAVRRLGRPGRALRLIASASDVADSGLKADGGVDERVDPPPGFPKGLKALLVRRGDGPHLLRVHEDLALTWRRERVGDPPRRGQERVFLTFSGTFFLDLTGRVALLH